MYTVTFLNEHPEVCKTLLSTEASFFHYADVLEYVRQEMEKVKKQYAVRGETVTSFVQGDTWLCVYPHRHNYRWEVSFGFSQPPEGTEKYI